MKLEPSDKLLEKDALLDDIENDLTNRNELVANVKHGLKSLAGRYQPLALSTDFVIGFHSFQGV